MTLSSEEQLQEPAQSSPHRNVERFCDNCGMKAPTRYVEFHQNIGMLVVRRSKSIKGFLCKACVSKYFREYTLVTLIFGWWGIRSFFATLVILPNNVIRYLSSKRPQAYRETLNYTPGKCPYCRASSPDEIVKTGPYYGDDRETHGYTFMWECHCYRCGAEWYAVER